jgi:hypothetical protein
MLATDGTEQTSVKSQAGFGQVSLAWAPRFPLVPNDGSPPSGDGIFGEKEKTMDGHLREAIKKYLGKTVRSHWSSNKIRSTFHFERSLQAVCLSIGKEG